jgi:predicted alpha/beta superfamily hydrolase
MKNRFLILALAGILLGADTRADAPDFSKLQGLGDTRFHLVESEALGHPLYLYVRVPERKPGAESRIYPTIYLLDGGTTFPLLSGYYHYLRLADEIPEMILVGISYGSDTFEGGNYRSSDFTAPAPDREWWGKAPRFQSVLKNELIPLIESAYPADPANRILFGQSLGGQFVLYTALTEPQLFSGLVASNPALHRNLDFFLRWQGQPPMPVRLNRLFVSVAEFDDERFRGPAGEWIRFWSDQENRPWTLEVRELAGQTHLSAAPESFRQGIQWLTGKDP